jgi:hypothetical protein
MRRVGHVQCFQERSAYKILGENLTERELWGLVTGSCECLGL